MAQCSIRLQTKNAEDIECPICLTKCLYPVELPCAHTFCFLCIKGGFARNGRCALCREPIPLEFWDDPNIVKPPDHSEGTENKYVWFYEGRDGWWQYDESSGFEIESAYNQLLTKVELLIAGQLYMVDFSRMIQYQKNSVSKRRRIKRDLICVPKKGVAGLKISCCPIPKDPSSSFTTIEKNSPDEVLVPTNSNSSDTLELSLLNLTISKD